MKERGFIGWILLIIISLAALKYFLDWDVFDAASSDQGKSTIFYIKKVVDAVWGVISGPVIFIWKEIFWPILSFAWNSFQDLIVKGKELQLESVSIPPTTP